MQDGAEVSLAPLPISRLRKFMRVWGEYVEYLRENAEKVEEEQDDELTVGDKQFEVFLDLAVISLGKQLQNGKSDEEFREYLENTLDEQTLYRVFDKCGGLKLNNDPNPQTAAKAASPAAGTN